MPKLKNNLCQLSKRGSFNFHTVLFTTNNKTILTRKSTRGLTKSKLNYHLTQRYFKKKSLIKLNKTENKKYIYDIIINPPDSSSELNFTELSYTTNDSFVEKDAQKNSFSLTYITKQNGTIVENNIFFSDEELQINNSDDDSDLITEKEALFNIRLYKNINN
ncbi:25735_t:CDS:1 [Dentiscutata erythropus]|uniref:25735_t:CDS:1 n=1 Tax=Dentiscutata erythropus TaxID=1348616 RepID=A0A9N9C0Q7_9GLOM|nr:25735_t:CDS:1 [Dentiscutata erythropus]